MLFEYLGNPANWFNLGFGIQALAAVFIAVGLLIFMPDSISRLITQRDNWGLVLVFVGLVILAPLMCSLGWQIVLVPMALALIIVGLVAKLRK